MAAAYAVACFGKYFDDRGVVLQTENEGVAAFAQKLFFCFLQFLYGVFGVLCYTESGKNP